MSAAKLSPQSNKTREQRTAILHLCADLESESPAREAVALAMLTQRSGWRAIIASAGGRLVNAAERTAVRHHRIAINSRAPFSLWRSRAQLKALLHRERPALIHTHDLDSLVHALPLCHHNRLPLVVDLAQPLPDDARTQRIMKAVRESAAPVRVPSSYMRDYLQRSFAMDPTVLHILPSGVDLQWFGAGLISPERLQTLNQLWRLPEQASILLVPMPLEPNLGHTVLLRAVASLQDPNIFTVLVGRDRPAAPMRAMLETLIDQLRLGGKVIMPDFCPDLPAACWLSSVVIAPNIIARGHNFELLAAQAIGRPVIVTDIGANRDYALEGETAWVVPPADVSALAASIREAVNLTTSQRLAIAETAHHFIADTFPQTHGFDRMMGLYESLLVPVARQKPKQAA